MSKFVPNQLQRKLFREVIDVYGGREFGETHTEAQVNEAIHSWLENIRSTLVPLANIAREALRERERGRDAVLLAMMAAMERVPTDTLACRGNAW